MSSPDPDRPDRPRQNILSVPLGGFVMVMFSLPLWSVAVWPMTCERDANRLLTIFTVSFVMFILLC